MLGAFLIFPALLVLQRILTGRFRQAAKRRALLGLFVPAILLSFSRAAWGQFVFTRAGHAGADLRHQRSPTQRLRIVLIAIAGVVVMALMLAALLSIDSVADLFKERASLEQSYDVGHLGRFGRYVLGAELALDTPLGIGPLQFRNSFPRTRTTRSSTRSCRAAGSPASCYLTLTPDHARRSAFAPCSCRTPWQPTYQVSTRPLSASRPKAPSSTSTTGGTIFLLLGVMWGLIAVSRAYRARAYAQAARDAAIGAARPLQPPAAPSYTLRHGGA